MFLRNSTVTGDKNYRKNDSSFMLVTMLDELIGHGCWITEFSYGHHKASLMVEWIISRNVHSQPELWCIILLY